MGTKLMYSFKLILVCIVAVPLDAVTVAPALCPSNKIAPHRRIVNWDYDHQSRTFGAFYDLFSLDNQPYIPHNSLQEQLQNDDPDDCGDIAEYDENDLSSLGTPGTQSQRRREDEQSKFFFGNLFQGLGGHRPPQGHPPQGNPQRPTIMPQRPTRPTRPPYSSGGYFGNNPYRPPLPQYPSDNVKPVHEGIVEPQTTYRPGVVGGPIGHVVGVTPVRPTQYPATVATPQRTQKQVRFPTRPNRPYQPTTTYPTRRPRPRKLDINENVFGSILGIKGVE